MNDVKDLYDRLRARPWPTIGTTIGDFALYDALLAGYAERAARGEIIDPSKLPLPDGETVDQVSLLRSKVRRTKEEGAFLEYFDLLAEIRTALSV